MNNKFRKILYVLLFAIMLSSAAYTCNYVVNRVEEEETFEEVRSKKSTVSVDNSESVDSEEYSEERKEILEEYKGLHDKNKDLYGWIKIEDTPVDYPVMFTPEKEDFYLYKDWNKVETKSGSIFIAADTKADSENVIIYGHNMKSKKMFGSLKKYVNNKDYYEEHKYIQFDTLYEKGTYQIISVVETVDYPEGYRFYDHIELNSEEEFYEYIDNAKKNACYNIETTAEFGDQIITLSTCHGSSKDGRLLIIAKKIN